MAAIKFGTDGWRGVIADDFTFANVECVSQAAADYWRRSRAPQTRQEIVVGYDRRFLSREFAHCSASVLVANGYSVVLSDRPVPTPSVSFAVKQRRAAGGIVITASHNPPTFNGFKLKAYYGGPANPAICTEVEIELHKRSVRKLPPEALLHHQRLKLLDLRPDHFAALKRLVDFGLIARSGRRFAHDALFGVGAGCFEDLLRDTTCRVTTLNARHDPLFGGINPEPIETNYSASRAFLRKHPHDICLVTDGDADRIGGMDGRGNYLTTHMLICLLLRHLVENRKGRGRIVKALTTTSMVDKMCAAYNLPLTITGVGFKYICDEMLRENVLLGAEESGGIGLPGHIPERDGIAAGLFLLELLAMERKPLSRLVRDMERRFGPHAYGRLDLEYSFSKRKALIDRLRKNPPGRLGRSTVEQIVTFDGVKCIARDGSWLMLRGSGTEPVLRVYAEAGTRKNVQALLRQGEYLTRTV